MKKVLALVALAGMFAFTSCGPSKEEMEKKQKMHDDSVRVADSITAEKDKAKMQHEADSMKQIEEANAAKMKMMADSLHQDSVKKHLKPKK
jgi:hypothetical protein